MLKLNLDTRAFGALQRADPETTQHVVVHIVGGVVFALAGQDLVPFDLVSGVVHDNLRGLIDLCGQGSRGGRNSLKFECWSQWRLFFKKKKSVRTTDRRTDRRSLTSVSIQDAGSWWALTASSMPFY
jgi:hypothetical protein